MIKGMILILISLIFHICVVIFRPTNLWCAYTVLLLKIRHLQFFGTLRRKRLSLIYGKWNPNNYNIASLNNGIAHFRPLVHMARESYEMEEVIAVDGPTPKRRKLTDYFAKLPSNTESQEFPQCLMSALMQDDKRFGSCRKNGTMVHGIVRDWAWLHTWQRCANFLA